MVILNQFIFSVVMLTIWSNLRNRVPGLGYWTKNIWAQTVSLVFVCFASLYDLPFLVNIFIFLSTLGSVLFLFGLSQSIGYHVQKTPYYAYTGIVTSLALAVTILGLPKAYNTLLFSLACMFISYAYISLLAKGWKALPWLRRTFSMMIAIYILFAAFNLIRFLATLPLKDPIILLPEGNQSLSQIITMILLTGINFCILIVIYKKLLHDLFLDAEEKETMLAYLKILAENDGMTGIFNRTTIEKQLDTLLVSKDLDRGNLLLLIDIDSFKAINDETGHENGDNVLIALAGLFKNFFTDGGFTGRWGGDEFLIVVTDIPKDGIGKCLQSLMEAVHQHPWDSIFTHTPHPVVSISCGYVFFEEMVTKQELLRIADNHLYQAKKQGGDCAVGT
ncbi:diguanylate cyclase (GGDEF) domain-containing protein [Sphaerochaeta pleomorpha str. Grapes]|uniref:diguanylate cyclase n=1 Tax=Sphaerochaeta pleomorpha (strain ATCC BAA-1885 / DSM 22778 / Grapes) TaxID=158190 RepID=G8QYM7_SPHPG|nr:GGDEF domain-containing protein [Sphaerochaeta pleomorpha]AEV28590.1 diguanylate cyclase (GGDEF) domain-containing protein [Sphaerochaeta pleomorpha str. Grapes]